MLVKKQQFYVNERYKTGHEKTRASILPDEYQNGFGVRANSRASLGSIIPMDNKDNSMSAYRRSSVKDSRTSKSFKQHLEYIYQSESQNDYTPIIESG